MGMAAVGSLIAGAYGVLHDQVTYTLSPEYFTQFKSEQFAWADFGWPIRVYVSEIGFMATWWVGFVAGWFLARLSVPYHPGPTAWRQCLSGFAVVFLFALVGDGVGAWLGWRRMQEQDLGEWVSFARLYGVKDIPRFVWVAFIHNASYLGGLVGLIAALILAARASRKVRAGE